MFYFLFITFSFFFIFKVTQYNFLFLFYFTFLWQLFLFTRWRIKSRKNKRIKRCENILQNKKRINIERKLFCVWRCKWMSILFWKIKEQKLETERWDFSSFMFIFFGIFSQASSELFFLKSFFIYLFTYLFTICFFVLFPNFLIEPH